MRRPILHWSLATFLGITACATPSAGDLLVPQDGVHLAGAARAMVPASPAGQCIVDTSASHLVFYMTPARSGFTSSLSLSIGGYHGTGTYTVTTKSSGSPLPSPGDEVFAAMTTPGAEWIADSGSITVLEVAGDGAIRGTLNVPKASSKGAGPKSSSTSTMQGTWACKVVPVPSPVVANG